MDYENKKIIYTYREQEWYRKQMINKCFAVLGIYEDCLKINDFNSYLSYINRLQIEFVGYHKITNLNSIMSIINILSGMSCINELSHKQIKSFVFHMISIIEKLKW